jgi:hypothetical protein
MTDCWIPRITLIGQIVLLCVCGALISLGRDSIITNLFAAGSGGLLSSTILTGAHKKLTDKGASAEETTK